VQNDIILSEYVWFDETFYTVRSDDIVSKESGDKLRTCLQNIFTNAEIKRKGQERKTDEISKQSDKQTMETDKAYVC
jgi:hypothetical protein